MENHPEPILPLSIEALAVLLDAGWKVYGTHERLAWIEAPSSDSSLPTQIGQDQLADEVGFLQNEDGSITVFLTPSV